MPLTNEFIFESSIIGAGLLIAIYTLAYPRIETIMNEKLKEIKKIIQEILTNTKESKEIFRKIKCEYRLPWSISWGFFTSAVLFSFFIPFSMIIIVSNISLPKFETGVFTVFYLITITLPIYIFIEIFLELHFPKIKKYNKIVKETLEKSLRPEEE